MRLLLVGAFPYPHYQGSQAYFQEQAHALQSAGAEVELLTYASGVPDLDTDASQRALTHHRPPGWTAPRGLDSGPAWGKPMADLAIAMTLRQRIASKSRIDAYDAILTHNAEACLATLVALQTLRGSPVPHLYCVHTLLGQELSGYFKSPKMHRFSDSSESRSGLVRSLDRLGQAIDRQLARHVDGWIALTQASQRVMRHSSLGPGELIPPPVSDPRADPRSLDPYAIAERYGLEPGRFFLYTGNLDGYQELGILGEAAQLLTSAVSDPARRPRLVLASHDPRVEARAAAMPGVESRTVGNAAEMQALLTCARASLLMRRTEGGYPIKLANAHAAGTPTIAFLEREWGLRDGENCLIAARDRPAASLASALLRLSADEDLAIRLRRGARALYLEQHRPEQAALRTIALIERVRAQRARSPRSAG